MNQVLKAALVSAALLIPSLSFSQVFPMVGKGVYIKNVRGYLKEELKTTQGLDRFMYNRVYVATGQCPTSPPPDTTCSVLRSLNLQPPKGKVVVNAGSEDVIPSYTAPEMADFLEDIGTSWVIIKAMDGTSRKLETAFSAACKAKGIKVFGSHVLRTTTSNPTAMATSGTAQAQAINQLRQDHAALLDGIVVIPGHMDEHRDVYMTTHSEHLAQAYLDGLDTTINVPFAYSPMFGMSCNPSDHTRIRVHRKFGTSDKMSALVPRCFWRASTPRTRTDHPHPSHSQKRDRVRKFMGDNVYPWLFHVDGITTKPVIPLGQAEMRQTTYTEVLHFAQFIQFRAANRPGGLTTTPLVQGVGYFSLDEFKIEDLVDFTKISWGQTPANDPYAIAANELPTFMSATPQPPCNQTPWMPGIVPPNRMPHPFTRLDYMRLFTDNVRDGDEPPECLPCQP